MRKILYLWMICVVLCSLVSCNDSDDKTYSSYVSRFVWRIGAIIGSNISM